MCHTRILCRLRFVPNNRNTTRQPLKESLDLVVGSLQTLTKQDRLRGDLLEASASFIEGIKRILQLISLWEKYRAIARLKDLIDGFYNIRATEQLDHLFAAIPHKLMDPSARVSLMNIIVKVGRYKEAARYLYRSTRGASYANDMKVILVEPSPEAFLRPAAIQSNISIASTIERIRSSNKLKWKIEDIIHLLHEKQPDVDTVFVQRVRKIIKEAKIHAEIQLLSYISLKKARLPPRVICSTKDACFLCNKFIDIYGIHTPGTHGKLYKGWRLPCLSHLNSLEQQFNLSLERQILSSITTLLHRRKKTSCPDPCESTLLTLRRSESTLAALGQGEVGSISKPTDTIPNTSQVSVPVLWTVPTENAHITTNETEVPNREGPKRTGIPIKISSRPQHLQEVLLEQGKVHSFSLNLGDVSPIYTTGNLEIQIDYDRIASHSNKSSSSDAISYCVEWLQRGEKLSCRYSTRRVINATMLEEEMKLDRESSSCFLLFVRGHYVKLQRVASGTDREKVM